AGLGEPEGWLAGMLVRHALVGAGLVVGEIGLVGNGLDLCTAGDTGSRIGGGDGRSHADTGRSARHQHYAGDVALILPRFGGTAVPRRRRSESRRSRRT